VVFVSSNISRVEILLLADLRAEKHVYPRFRLELIVLEKHTDSIFSLTGGTDLHIHEGEFIAKVSRGTSLLYLISVIHNYSLGLSPSAP
jgi:hypothetical protein